MKMQVGPNVFVKLLLCRTKKLHISQSGATYEAIEATASIKFEFVATFKNS